MTIAGDQPICERRLTRQGVTGPSDVVVRLLAPVLVPHEYVGDYRCAFEIDGLDVPIRGYGYGIDSLQALTSANTRAMYALWTVRQSLRWLDGSYDWFIADCVQIDDAGRRRQIREILDEEDYALTQSQVDTELIRRAKTPKAPVPQDAADPPELGETEGLAESELESPVCTGIASICGTKRCHCAGIPAIELLE